MADRPSAVSGVFRRPFPEQVAFFRGKLARLVPTSRWDDLLREEHDRAFMVAGAQKADLLADLATAVDGAIAEGKSLDAFRKDFADAVERHDWHGWTGEDTKGGRAWRTRTIYRTNAATSYAAGRFAQLQAGNFAFWVYRHGGSREPRVEHLSWDGWAGAPDHPFWSTHYPPSDWGCSCYVVGARTAAGVRRMGGDPAKVLPANWRARNPRTGAPVGIGRGWDYAPGASVAPIVRGVREKLDRYPPELATAVMQEWLATAFQRWAAAPDGAWPLVRLPDEDAALIGAKRAVADLSAETMLKQQRAHPELDWSDYALAQQVVSAPTHRLGEGDASLIYLQESEAGGYVLVVKATRTREGLFVTSFRRLSRDAARRDREVRRLLRRQE